MLWKHKAKVVSYLLELTDQRDEKLALRAATREFGRTKESLSVCGEGGLSVQRSVQHSVDAAELLKKLWIGLRVICCNSLSCRQVF